MNLSIRVIFSTMLMVGGLLLDARAADRPQAGGTIEGAAAVAGKPATPPSDKSKFKIFLLVGQSNMAGRALATPKDAESDPRVLVLNKLNQWYCQGEPIHFDKPGACGVGPGFTFAKLLAEQEPGITVGLVPCAFGGTSVAQWSPTSTELFYKSFNLYNNALRRTKLAMESGTLAGILWHQGESDAGQWAKEQEAVTADPTRAPQTAPYAVRLGKLVTQFRTDLNAPKVPFVAGEINNPKKFNSQIDQVTNTIPNSAVVSIQGFQGDDLHFNNAQQKELAQRYLLGYLKLQQK